MRESPTPPAERAPRPVAAADCDTSTLRARLSGMSVRTRPIEAELRAAARDRVGREVAGTRQR